MGIKGKSGSWSITHMGVHIQHVGRYGKVTIYTLIHTTNYLYYL